MIRFQQKIGQYISILIYFNISHSDNLIFVLNFFKFDFLYRNKILYQISIISIIKQITNFIISQQKIFLIFFLLAIYIFVNHNFLDILLLKSIIFQFIIKTIIPPLAQMVLLAFKRKVDQLHLYFFPQHHSISIHHSPINPNILFYIRLASLLYLTAIYIWAITTTKSALNNIIYLTMQGYFLAWLYFVLCIQDYMINGFGKWGRVFPICNNLKYYIEIIFEIAFCVQLPVTLIFWGFLFKYLIQADASLEIIIINANLHAAPLIALILDLVYNSFSFPKQHFHAVIFFSSLYGIVNLAYSLTATIIYAPIDWVSILSYVLLIAAVLMAFFMHWLGRYIYNKWKKDKMQSQMLEGLLGSSHKNKLNSTTQGQDTKVKGDQNKDSTQDKHNISVLTEDL